MLSRFRAFLRDRVGYVYLRLGRRALIVELDQLGRSLGAQPWADAWSTNGARLVRLGNVRVILDRP